MSNLRRARPRVSAGGLFISLSDGDHVDVVPLGDVRVKFVSWDPAERRYQAHPEPGDGVQTQWVLCVYDVDQGAQRILTLSNQTMQDLLDELGEGPHVYRIRRRGQGPQTRYTIRRLDDQADQAAKIVAREGDGDLELRDTYDPADFGLLADAAAAAPSQEADDDVPF